MNSVTVIFTGAVSVLYLIYFLRLRYLWNKEENYLVALPNTPITKVSVVIAARSEAQNISTCLHDIIHQNYPSDLVEIIVVDDNSTDTTVSTIQQISKAHPKNVLRLILVAASGRAKDLGTLGGSYSVAFGINGSGQVAGNIYAGAYRATRWDGTHSADLGMAGDSYSYARGINDAGQVVGERFLAGDLAYRATRWDGTTPTDLGTLGGISSTAFAINAVGQAAGYSTRTGSATPIATRWDGTTPIDLGTLGGPSSAAYGINEAGQVIGFNVKEARLQAHGYLTASGHGEWWSCLSD